VLYSFAGPQTGRIPEQVWCKTGRACIALLLRRRFGLPVSNNNFGCGTVFKLDTGGNRDRAAHVHWGLVETALILRGLVEDAQGIFMARLTMAGFCALPMLRNGV